MGTPAVVVRRGADRPVSAGGGITSRHGLSFGAHYDPERTSVGALVAHNDDRLDPGVSYGRHTHSDVEILTWVLSGTMAHVGPAGREDVVEPGVLQVLGAGTGWEHDERCVGPSPVHLLQMWVAPGPDDPPPSAPTLRHVAVDLSAGPVVPVTLQRPGVSVWVARLAAGSSWSVPSATWRHVHVARGGLATVGVEGDSLEMTGDRALEVAGEGDSVEIGGAGELELVPGDDGAEVLVIATA